VWGDWVVAHATLILATDRSPLGPDKSQLHEAAALGPDEPRTTPCASIEVEIIPDDAPREVEVPADLATALADAPDAAAFLAGLSHTHQLAYVLWIEDAKKPETRSARVAKAVEMLSGHHTR
jgi:hypothetical protein